MFIIQFCYTKFHPITWTTLRKNAPTAIMANVNNSPYAYWEQFNSHWNNGNDSLINIEHDIEVPAGSIESLVNCSEPWCSYGYPAAAILTESLGFTKYSANLQANVAFVPRIEYGGLDAAVHRMLTDHYSLPHVHGAVRHFHDYGSGYPGGQEYLEANVLSFREKHVFPSHISSGWYDVGM